MSLGSTLFVVTSSTYVLISFASRKRMSAPFVWFYSGKKEPLFFKTSTSSSPAPVVAFDALSRNPSASSPLLRSHFDSEGYVIVRGVLSPSEVCVALSGVWSFVEAASAVKTILHTPFWDRLRGRSSQSVCRNTRETWRADAWPDALEGGILNKFGAGQSRVSWYVREREGVTKTFQAFWGKSDLITSFDGLILWRGAPYITEKGWFHVDQNPMKKPNFSNVQGLVNLIQTSAETGGNVLIRRSQKHFPEHYCGISALPHYKGRLQELDGENWLEIPADDPLLDEAFATEDVIMSELLPGDMLLWDSRTIHCSHPGTGSGLDEGAVRAAVLVTMMPRCMVAKSVLDSRRGAIEQGITATHWVDEEPVVLGGERGEDKRVEEERVKRMREMGAILGLADVLSNGGMRQLV